MTLEEQLKRDEQSGKPALRPYRDSEGLLTIGWGRCLDTKGITVEEADYLLADDIASTVSELLRVLPWTENLRIEQPARFSVLVNMAFNLGVDGLCDFHRTLEHVKNSDFYDASEEMLKSSWSLQVGDRALRLAKQMAEGRELV